MYLTSVVSKKPFVHCSTETSTPSAKDIKDMTSALTDPDTDRMPADADMLEAYLSSAHRLIELSRSTGDASTDIIIRACPAWNVRDLLSHVTSIASRTLGRAAQIEDVQEWIDHEVAVRADKTVEEVAQEYEALLPDVKAALTGRNPFPLVVDVTTHEHDLRDSLGAGAADHEAGIEAVLPSVIRWVRTLHPKDGAGIVLRTPTSEVTFGGSAAGLEVELDSDWELYRLLAVRRSSSQIEAYTHTGDLGLLFELVGRYPIPENPLDDQF